MCRKERNEVGKEDRGSGKEADATASVGHRGSCLCFVEKWKGSCLQGRRKLWRIMVHLG